MSQPTQTYCERADLEAIWSPVAVVRAADDDQDGELSPSEEAYVERCIERAANRMNAALELRYPLVQLAENTWCRDCNAGLAAYLLATRRGNPAPPQIQEQYQALLADLADIRDGRLKVPQTADGLETIPTATNFDVDLSGSRARQRPVRATE